MARINVTEHTIAIRGLPAGFAGYRILQISDLHLGRGHLAGPLLDTIRPLNVDLVALTGDLIQRRPHIPLLRPFLVELTRHTRSADGIVGIWGNHDRYVPDREVEALPIRWLRNEWMPLRRGSAALNLIGANQKAWTQTDLLAPLTHVIPGAPIILLAHFPSTVYLLNGIVDLVIAGHTHAGQVRLPGLPFSTNDDLSWRHARGVSQVGNTRLVVSAGLGTSGPLAFRLFAHAEVTVIQLTSNGS